MTKSILTAALLLFAFVSHAQEDEGDSQAPAQLSPVQTKYMNFLKGKGYTPEVDKDGDLKFRHKDRSYYITIDKTDDKFFRLMRIANLKLDTEKKKSDAFKICNELTADMKVVKVYWYNNMIWVSCEQFMKDPNDYEEYFNRLLKLASDAYADFLTKWKKVRDSN